MAAKGATGYGVQTLNRFISENYEKLKQARDSDLVDYTLVSEIKNKALELLYADFI